MDRQVKENFLQTVARNEHGRDEISLPWAEDKPPLSDNLYLSKKRLTTVTNRDRSKNIGTQGKCIFGGPLTPKLVD